MKTNITASLMENTLTMTKAFYKKASIVGSDEYYELRKAMEKVLIVWRKDKGVHRDRV